MQAQPRHCRSLTAGPLARCTPRGFSTRQRGVQRAPSLPLPPLAHLATIATTAAACLQAKHMNPTSHESCWHLTTLT